MKIIDAHLHLFPTAVFHAVSDLCIPNVVLDPACPVKTFPSTFHIHKNFPLSKGSAPRVYKKSICGTSPPMTGKDLFVRRPSANFPDGLCYGPPMEKPLQLQVLLGKAQALQCLRTLAPVLLHLHPQLQIHFAVEKPFQVLAGDSADLLQHGPALAD